MVNTFENYLKSHKVDKELAYLLRQLSNAGKEIYRKMKTANFNYTKSTNATGDRQLNFDITADNIIEKFILKSNVVYQFVSEERDKETIVKKNSKSLYMVAYDPLDGSSVTDTNFAVGSSFSIFPTQNHFKGVTGNDAFAAIFLMYGPNLKLAYTVGKGTHTFKLSSSGYFILEEENIKLEISKKYCSLGDFQDAENITGYKKLIHKWMDEDYKLRYSGSLCADIFHILRKKGGVFAYPSPKLRLLYECIPQAFLLTQAGGIASNEKQSILDIKCTDIHQTEKFIGGSKKEVDEALKFLR